LYLVSPAGSTEPHALKDLERRVYGIDARIIEVEVDLSGIKANENYFHTVGLPDAAVRESRDRVAPRGCFPTSLHSLNSFALSAHGSCAC
jgi:hypothetical protein